MKVNIFINKISNEISPEEFVVLTDEFASIEEKIPVPVLKRTIKK